MTASDTPTDREVDGVVEAIGLKFDNAVGSVFLHTKECYKDLHLLGEVFFL